MRRNRSEISVFSVSALDVFASALGAFIILSAISLPFIFNTSMVEEISILEIEKETQVAPSDELESVIQDLGNQLTDLRQRLQEVLDDLQVQASLDTQSKHQVEQITSLRNRIQELEKQLANLETEGSDAIHTLIPPIDIVIAIDTTGSMVGQVTGLKDQIIQLSQILVRWSESPAIGIVEFKDQCEYEYRNLLPITPIDGTSIRDIRRFSTQLEAGGITGCNEDLPEAFHLALRDALELQWRPDSKEKVIIVISDQIPYPNQIGQTKNLAQRFVSDLGGRVSVVHVIQSWSTPGDRRILEQIATQGNGDYIVGGPSSSFIGSVLLAVR